MVRQYSDLTLHFMPTKWWLPKSLVRFWNETICTVLLGSKVVLEVRIFFLFVEKPKCEGLLQPKWQTNDRSLQLPLQAILNSQSSSRQTYCKAPSHILPRTNDSIKVKSPKSCTLMFSTSPLVMCTNDWNSTPFVIDCDVTHCASFFWRAKKLTLTKVLYFFYCHICLNFHFFL